MKCTSTKTHEIGFGQAVRRSDVSGPAGITVQRDGEFHNLGFLPDHYEGMMVFLETCPEHALMINGQTPLLQFVRDSPITLHRGFQRSLLHLIAYFHLDRLCLPRYAPAIETGAVQNSHLAQRIHGLALRMGLLDFCKQAFAPLTTAGG